jgi:lysophospholipase L1-like esterase
LKPWFWSAERAVLRGGLITQRIVKRLLGRARHAAPMTVWKDQPRQPIETVMVGDSIVRRFPKELSDGLSAQPVINHGWGGDTIEDVAGRIEASTSRAPRRLIFQVGTNDLLQGHSVATTAAAFAVLAGATAAALPGSEIGICALPPIARWRARPSAVRELNERLKEIADSIHARYIDVYSPLSSRTGTPLPGVTTDGVHLTNAAYVTYAAQLRPLLEANVEGPTH